MAARIAISGTGFISKQLLRVLRGRTDFDVVAILSRRPSVDLHDFPEKNRLVSTPSHLIAGADVVVECSGDPIHAANVVAAAFEQGLPVVTMNTEFHVTCGSAFVDQGWLSEAEGDQPGCTAALARHLRGMGFRPLVYGNMKGFLNHNPSPSEMAFWSEKQGISIEQVTAFTDGTKIQMEQALLANGCGAHILSKGLLGLPAADRRASAMKLAEMASSFGSPIADYVIGADLPPGVFVVADQGCVDPATMSYLKMGKGPHYYFERPYHLCGLEILSTIKEALRGDPPLLNNGRNPSVGVAAIAKRDLEAGCLIGRGMGGFDVRGEVVSLAEFPDYVPIGILFGAELTAKVREGDYLKWDNVRLPDSLALNLCRQTLCS
jgi:predicted homoserine dehydrogenase-like protein